jgi:hypothetical protein
MLGFQDLARANIWRGICVLGSETIHSLARDELAREKKMLLDLIAYVPLASAVLFTSLRLFFEKPNRREIPISFPKAIPPRHHAESSSVDA